LAHNYYQQPGGEDRVFASEAALLTRRGHEVVTYTVSNDAVERMRRGRLAMATLWNRDTYHSLRAVVRRERPDVAHFHNTFPLLSPAAYRAARDEGVAVVQTLHNYRLLCANALFLRSGHVCEDCLGKRVPWPGVLHACYRDSRTATAGVAALVGTHRLLRTWTREVDVFIALSEFARRKFVQGGLPQHQIRVKPNFVDPDPGIHSVREGFALFVGRLDEQKGVSTLLEAWSASGLRTPLRIVGDGPLLDRVRRFVDVSSCAQWLGRLAPDAVAEQMARASYVVIPSRSYENFPLVVAEAFANATPVIASDLGAFAEIVRPRVTGLLFRPGDAAHLAEQAEWAASHPEAMAAFGCNARKEYEERYTADENYRLLIDIYRAAIAARPRPRSESRP